MNPADIQFLRTTAGAVHAVIDHWDAPSGGWMIRALCEAPGLTGSPMKMDIATARRNPDLCRACDKFLA